MRVLMLTANLDLPEAHLVTGLVENGVNIKIIMSKDSPFQEVLRNKKVEIDYWNFKNRIDLKSIRYIKKILAQEKYDIIHTFSARALTSALIASLFKPLRHVTYRGTTGHLSRLDPSSWLSYLNPKISKIICVSDAVKNYLLKVGVKEDRLIRIYKGHDPLWYKYDIPLKRSDFDINANTFLIGCSANMRPVKGADLLIKAMEFIPEETNIKLILIGEIRDSNIESLVKNKNLKDRIIMTGFRKDAPAITALCNVFCMPSRKREGLPKALIEAMIQGVTPVVTDVGGMPELVENLKEGLVVQEENPKALADAIIYLYNDRHSSSRFGDAAREKILSNFTIKNTVIQTFNLYKEISL